MPPSMPTQGLLIVTLGDVDRNLHRVQMSGISTNPDFGKVGMRLLAFHTPSRGSEDSLTVSRGWPHSEVGR